ncbi:hypothetical protein [Ensifer sp. 4252]|uniref:hypothetical protein n=1 Tax=Ensifer sp. 4252 TaxID=3373915 RepID=UPI003D22409B
MRTIWKDPSAHLVLRAEKLSETIDTSSTSVCPSPYMFERPGFCGRKMDQNETENHFQMNNLEQRMRKAYKDGQRIVSKKEAAQLGRANFLIAIALAASIGVLLAIFF